MGKQLKPSYRDSCVYRLLIIFFLNVVKNKRLRRMSTTLLLGLSLCSMVARVFPTEDSVQTNGTKGPMETIVIQRELNWGNMESRLANVESGIADLKSLILKLIGSGNGGNASQPVGGSKGENVVEDKDNVAATKRDCTNAEDCFSVFGEENCWECARRRCQALGEDLATLSSVAETRSLQKYLKKIGRSTVWVGSKKGKTDGKNPGNWKWITGEPVPTDGTVGKVADSAAHIKMAGCLIIHDEESARGYHDFCRYSCDRSFAYVCSKTR